MSTALLEQKIGDEKAVEPSRPSDISEQEELVIKRVWNRFTQLKNLRETPSPYFNDRSLTEYIDDSVQRFISYVVPREDLEDWQSRVTEPISRNKLIAVMAKVSSAFRLVAEAHKRGDEDRMRSRVASEILHAADDFTDDDKLIFFAMLEAASKGTVFGFEGYKTKKRKIREIDMEKSNFAENLIEFKEKEIVDYDDVYGEVWPLEECYPGEVFVNLSVKDYMQQMPDFMRRKVMTIWDFKRGFQKFSGAKNIKRAGDLTQDSYFKQFISPNLRGDEVEVIWWFNKDDDEFIIYANGRCINLLPNGVVSPFPWLHKKLPIWHALFEPLAIDFIFGKSLPDKMKGQQDSYDAGINMMLDQWYLSIFKPILTTAVEDIEDDFLVPGRKIPVDDINQWKELDISPPNLTSFRMLELLSRSIEQSSVDVVSQGVAGQGSRTTATEVERARQAAVELAGLFLKFMKWGKREKSRLRLANALQFYFLPTKVEKLVGEGGGERFVQAFRSFKVEGVPLAKLGGRKGTRVIKVVGSQDELPSKDEVMAEEAVKSSMEVPVEVLYITPDYIRNFEYDIKVHGEEAPQETKAVKKAFELEWQRALFEIYPEKKGDKTFEDFAEAFDKNPDDYPSASPTDDIESLLLGGEGKKPGGLGNTPSQALEGIRSQKNVNEGLKTKLRA